MGRDAIASTGQGARGYTRAARRVSTQGSSAISFKTTVQDLVFYRPSPPLSRSRVWTGASAGSRETTRLALLSSGSRKDFTSVPNYLLRSRRGRGRPRVPGTGGPGPRLPRREPHTTPSLPARPTHAHLYTTRHTAPLTEPVGARSGPGVRSHPPREG